MKLEDLRPHMSHTTGFTRYIVARALAKVDGGGCDPRMYLNTAGRLLKEARASGVVRYIEGRARSCYYNFVKTQSEAGG